MADKIEVVISIALSAAARNLPDIVLLASVLLAQLAALSLVWRKPSVRGRKWLRVLLAAATGLSCFFLVFGFLIMYARVGRYFPTTMGYWVRGLAMIWAMLSLMWTGAWLVWKVLAGITRPAHSPARRGFLRASGAALAAAPVAVMGYAVFVERHYVRLREEQIAIPGLAEDLDGIRIVQLTDIHLSPYLSEKELAHAIGIANETNAHLALVTGDMISYDRDPLDSCLKHLSGLRAEAGIFGCLGNHEIYAKCEDYATEQGARMGIRYLRSEAARLKFGGATMNLAGVDYQLFHKPYLTGAEKMIVPGVFNVLMSHNPDVFPVAARQGYDLTIAGHTHGGQVRVEILHADLNVARYFTRFVDGSYHRDGRSIFVSRGIGTIGLPARLGAPPEVALLRLCRS
jgi:predicted MPP superfamily phosphohydrolase